VGRSLPQPSAGGPHPVLALFSGSFLQAEREPDPDDVGGLIAILGEVVVQLWEWRRDPQLPFAGGWEHRPRRGAA